MTQEAKKETRKIFELLGGHQANYLLLIAAALLVADAIFTILEYKINFEITNIIMIFVIGGCIWLFMHTLRTFSKENHDNTILKK